MAKETEGKDLNLQNVEKSQGVSNAGIADIAYSLELLAKSHYMKNGDIDGAVDFIKQSYMKNYLNDGDDDANELEDMSHRV